MSKKAYTKEQRAQIRQQLLDEAMELFNQKGIQAVKLSDLLKKLNISKPFFYTFYDSINDLILAIIERQRSTLEQLIQNINETEKDWEQQIRKFMSILLTHRQNHVFILSPHDEVWVYNHLKKEQFELFQQEQLAFFKRMFRLWDIDLERCDGAVLGNLILSIIIVRNNAKTDLPFFFQEQIETAAQIQVDFLIQYLKQYHNEGE